MENNEDKYLKLVNRDNRVKEPRIDGLNYVAIETNEGTVEEIEEETSEAYEKLRDYFASKKVSISINKNGALRTLETQKDLYDDAVRREGKEYADKYVALPGASEHHTGLAVDVRIEPAFVKRINTPIIKKVVRRLTRPALYWVMKNKLHYFGFIPRYEKKKIGITGIEDEPWHIRYVGKKHAEMMKEMGMCLEEYVEYINSNKDEMGE